MVDIKGEITIWPLIENDLSQASSGNQIRNSDPELPPENSSEAALGSSSPTLFLSGPQNLDNIINGFKWA